MSCPSVNGYRRLERAGRYFILQLLFTICLTLKINTVRSFEIATIVYKPVGSNRTQHLNLHGINLNIFVLVITAGSLGKSRNINHDHFLITFPLLLDYLNIFMFLKLNAEGVCGYQWNLYGYFVRQVNVVSCSLKPL
jgi:hypothetical protein